MNPRQSQFYQYMEERIKSEYFDVADQLLKEGFEKQNNGTFNKEYFVEYKKQMLSYIKEDSRNEVEAVMSQFSINLK